MTFFLFCLIIHPVLTPETVLTQSDKWHGKHYSHHKCQKQQKVLLLLQMTWWQTEYVGGEDWPIYVYYSFMHHDPPRDLYLSFVICKAWNIDCNWAWVSTIYSMMHICVGGLT